MRFTRGLYERVAIPFASSRPGSYFYVNVAPSIDRVLLRLTGGRLTTGGVGRVGFLKVKGAKSGIERTTPLVYTRDGEKILLVASRGGDVKHPAWYHNLRANPEVSFVIDGGGDGYVARLAKPAERVPPRPLVCRTYPGYETYQRRAGDRKIPIVVLEPRG